MRLQIACDCKLQIGSGQIEDCVRLQIADYVRLQIADCVGASNSRDGFNKWAAVAAALPNRTGKQCRDRWVNHLDPSINKSEWTTKENAILLSEWTANKNSTKNWAELAKLLPGRTVTDVKNRYRQLDRAGNVTVASRDGPLLSPRHRVQPEAPLLHRTQVNNYRTEAPRSPSITIPAKHTRLLLEAAEAASSATSGARNEHQAARQEAAVAPPSGATAVAPLGALPTFGAKVGRAGTREDIICGCGCAFTQRGPYVAYAAAAYANHAKTCAQGKEELQGSAVDEPAETTGAKPKAAAWEAQLPRLAAYKVGHGDSSVPRRWAEDPTLGRWVGKQRYLKRQLDRGEPCKGMTVERAARLTALGLVWDPRRRSGQDVPTDAEVARVAQLEVAFQNSPARSPAGCGHRNAGGARKIHIPLVGAEVDVLFTEHDGSKRWAVGEVIQSDEAQVSQLQPVLAAFLQECMGQLASFGPT
jgi:hypothetical protein